MKTLTLEGKKIQKGPNLMCETRETSAVSQGYNPLSLSTSAFTLNALQDARALRHENAPTGARTQQGPGPGTVILEANKL